MKNRRIVEEYIREVLINRKMEKLHFYLDVENYTENTCHMNNRTFTTVYSISEIIDRGNIKYNALQGIFGEGDFILAVSEGFCNGIHSSLYDLFRMQGNKIIEHWDTMQQISINGFPESNN